MKNNLNRNLKDRLYIATVCGQHREILRQYGIGAELDQFCTAERMEGAGAAEACREVESLLPMASGVVLHAPFNELFPAAIDPRARALARDRLESAAALALHYGAKKMVVHSGYVPFVYFKEWHVARSVEFWQKFMEGKPEDFQIVIENVLEEEPDMMVEMMEQLSHPRIRLCLDAGHALCVGKVPVFAWLTAMAPWLGHLHIHNNDGVHDRHDPLTKGLLDMEVFLDEAVRLCGADTTITVECLDGGDSMRWLCDRGYLSPAGTEGQDHETEGEKHCRNGNCLK